VCEGDNPALIVRELTDRHGTKRFNAAAFFLGVDDLVKIEDVSLSASIFRLRRKIFGQGRCEGSLPFRQLPSRIGGGRHNDQERPH
jgi:hypothetical protein